MNDVNERNLREVVLFLQKRGVNFWVDQGTLLGIVRDDALLPWDKDIDLSTWPEDFEQIVQLRPDLERMGYYFELHEYKDCLFLSKEQGYAVEIARYQRVGDIAIRRNNGPRNRPVERFIKRLLDLLPDAIHFRLRNFGRRWHVKETITFRTPAHYFSELRVIPFRDMNVPIPAATEAYLTFKYGPNWRVPVRDWDFSQQDGSVVNRSGAAR